MNNSRKMLVKSLSGMRSD